VYNTDLIRQLCDEIVSEQDPDKVSELIALLRAIMSDDHEEVRTRILPRQKVRSLQRSRRRLNQNQHFKIKKGAVCPRR
jgi:hypothetical protein